MKKTQTYKSTTIPAVMYMLLTFISGIFVIIQVPIPFIGMGGTQVLCAFCAISFMGTMYQGRVILLNYTQWLMLHDFTVKQRGEGWVTFKDGERIMLASKDYGFALEEAYQFHNKA